MVGAPAPTTQARLRILSLPTAAGEPPPPPPVSRPSPPVASGPSGRGRCAHPPLSFSFRILAAPSPSPPRWLAAGVESPVSTHPHSPRPGARHSFVSFLSYPAPPLPLPSAPSSTPPPPAPYHQRTSLLRAFPPVFSAPSPTPFHSFVTRQNHPDLTLSLLLQRAIITTLAPPPFSAPSSTRP